MSYTRTVQAQVPQPGQGARIVATALLEAADVDGEPGTFVAIEAKPGALDRIASRHAIRETGWYCLQWHDDRQVSTFSDPVRLSGPVASNAGRVRR